MIEIFKFDRFYAAVYSYTSIAGAYLHGKAVLEIGGGIDNNFMLQKRCLSEITGDGIYDIIYGRKKGKLYFWRVHEMKMNRGLIILEGDEEARKYAEERFKNRYWLI